MTRSLSRMWAGLFCVVVFLAVSTLGFFPSPRSASTAPRTPAISLAGRAMAAEKAKSITFDDIKFEMKKEDLYKRSMLTEKIEAMHGQSVTIRGWILPTSTFQLKGIKNFVLVRDNMECCFGPGAALYDSMQVDMDSGKTVDFTTRPIAVEGVFSIREFKIDGKVYSVYHLQAVKAK